MNREPMCYDVIIGNACIEEHTICCKPEECPNIRFAKGEEVEIYLKIK
jgi:hypothetical protein